VAYLHVRVRLCAIMMEQGQSLVARVPNSGPGGAVHFY